MGDIAIKRITNKDKDFYNIMGPMLSKRQIVKELGNNVWDDDGKIWYVAMINKKVCGFVAALEQSKNVLFCSDYILPEYRGQGIYELLFAARLSDFKNSVITSTITDASMRTYLSNGFVETGTRGKYHVVRRNPNND